MKTPILIIATMLCIAPLHARTDKTPIYKDAKAPIEQRIKAGQSHTFVFNIVPQRYLRYLDANGNTILEPGDYRIMVADKTVTPRLDK